MESLLASTNIESSGDKFIDISSGSRSKSFKVFNSIISGKYPSNDPIILYDPLQGCSKLNDASFSFEIKESSSLPCSSNNSIRTPGNILLVFISLTTPEIAC